MTLHRWLFLVGTVVAQATLSAASPPRELAYAKPDEAGMSAAILRGAVGTYEEAIARGRLAGAVLLVARDGKVVLHEAVGWSDVEQKRPMERSTIFHTASNTKPVVATGIATLVEDEKIGYDTPVREYIPEWDNYRAGFITVGQLLSHRGGLRIRGVFLEPLSPDTTLQREAARYGTVGAARTPGQSVRYSNPGYNTLAALIEIVSGMPLEDYLRARVYAPLGMTDTYHYSPGHALDGKLDRLGPIYREGDDGELRASEASVYPFARGSGGVVATAWDYAVFCQMFLDRGAYGDVRILDEETVARMTSIRHPFPRGGGGTGYGWFVDADGSYDHGGGHGTDAWVDPERGIIGLAFTQTPRGRALTRRFRELVNLAIEPE